MVASPSSSRERGQSASTLSSEEGPTISISSKKIAAASEKRAQTLAALSQKALEDLQRIKLSYPGWKRDLEKAVQDLEQNNAGAAEFYAQVNMIKKKQAKHEQTQSYNRLQCLVSLTLTYPGHESDVQHVEEWLIRNENDDKNFQDKLQGLKNKEALFRNDRSHQNIVALDALKLDYPGWETDYQVAVSAHCDRPDKLFPDAIHCLSERQNAHEGKRSHWRLTQLDKLNLSYPGSSEDRNDIETWHYQNADSPENLKLFMEAVDGMKEQEELFKASTKSKEPEIEVKEEDLKLPVSDIKITDKEDVNKKLITAISSSDDDDIETDASVRAEKNEIALSNTNSTDDTFSASDASALSSYYALSQPTMSEDDLTKLFHESSKPIKDYLVAIRQQIEHNKDLYTFSGRSNPRKEEASVDDEDACTTNSIMSWKTEKESSAWFQRYAICSCRNDS